MIPTNNYQPEIDGLRALAVVSVIINHFSNGLLPGGYLGVDIFFVISGFVITSSLADYPSKNFGDFLLRFYVRRIKRLIPALVISVIISGLLMWILVSTPSESLRTGQWALVGGANVFLANRSTDYFAPSTEFNLFTHTWSLGVEEQFYVLFPVLVWLTGFSRRTPNAEKKLLWVLCILSVGSLATYIYLNDTSPSLAYFLMPSRFWELGAGCLLFVGIEKFPSGIVKRFNPSLLFIVMLAVLFVPSSHAIQATIIIVITTMLLIGSIRPMTIAHAVLTRKEIVYIGLASYSLYLWHWPVLSLSRWTIGITGRTIPFLILTILLISFASYRFIEKPLRSRQWTKSARGILCLGLITVGIGILVLGVMIRHPYRNITEKESALKRETVFHGQYKGIECNNYAKTDFSFSCTSPKGKDVPRAFFLGDSFNQQLLMMKLRLHHNEGLDIYSYSSNNCNDKPKVERGECLKQTEGVYSLTIGSIRQGDFVLLSYYFQNNDRQSWLLSNQDYMLFKDFALKLSKKGAKLIVLSPLPQMTNLEGLHISVCLSLPPGRLEICRVKKKEVLQWHDATHRLLSKLESDGLVYEYNPMDSLCLGGYCDAVSDDGFPVYSEDGYHLTDYAVDKFVYPSFLDFLRIHEIDISRISK
ncbi:MAG: acyltransferase [Betaproteobacteria bacterium]|nr:acyltransferase [Betaproteobacteria bacterium]